MKAIKLVLVMLFSLAIVACGSGGTTPANNPPAPVAATGVLADSPVQGVSYIASPSGKNGITDVNGAYNFNVGDMVEFKLGSLVLGNVTATGIVTPTELAANNANKLANLLVLLQSLDVDGDAANGISIPPAAAAAVTTAIDLTVPPASLNTTALQTAMTAGGIATPIVSEAEAAAHYLAQGTAFLASNIWVAHSADSAMMLRFDATTGQYLHGQATPTDLAGTAGAEFGTANMTAFDIYGYKILAVTSIDTNLQWGLSHPLNCDRVRSVGDQLIAYEDKTTPGTCETSVVLEPLNKAENNPTGIVGVWALGSATNLNTQHFTFFSDAKYIMVDPLGDTETGPNDPSCGGPGVEAGSYTFVNGSLSVSNITYDTNGCAGLNDNTPSGTGLATHLVTLDAVGATASITAITDGATNTLYRVTPWAVNMVGKTINSVVTSSRCPGVPGGWNYTFTNTAMTLTGSDGWLNCVLKPEETFTLVVAGLGSDFDIPFNCSAYPICTSADFNKTLSGIDQDGRAFTSTYSFNVATSTLTYVKTATETNNSQTTYTETMSFQ